MGHNLSPVLVPVLEYSCHGMFVVTEVSCIGPAKVPAFRAIKCDAARKVQQTMYHVRDILLTHTRNAQAVRPYGLQRTLPSIGGLEVTVHFCLLS